MNKEITSSPAELIRTAVAGRADLGQLEKLLELQDKWETNEARKAYHKAMAEFKANPPKISKDKHVKYATSKGSMDYRHASLANVCNTINSELSKYGLSASWQTKQNGQILVTCKITHSQGHSEETTLQAAADLTGSKNSIQAIGSTISYLQRYTLLSITGLATSDMDNDGQGSTDDVITLDQVVKIKNLVSAHKANITKLLKFVNASKLEDILQRDYDRVIKTLEDYNARKEVENGNK